VVILAYIYKISNDINDKVYIGKTYSDIQDRFREHCADSKKRRCEKRPLYNAMNKYGIEHFFIELVEETDDPSEREKFWIAYYNSYHNGYNGTKGGDGKSYLDHDLIIQTYQREQNMEAVARIVGACKDQIRSILKSNHIDIKRSQEIEKPSLYKAVQMLDLETHQVLKSFESVRSAARYLIENSISNSKLSGTSCHISEVCSGKRKSAYGFMWTHI
jgi:group I intron endonuclease